MLWLPAPSVGMTEVATPADSVAEPMIAAPSMNVTVPSGVPPIEVTVAVNVTPCPYVLGLGDAVSVVAVGLTTWVSVAESEPS